MSLKRRNHTIRFLYFLGVIRWYNILLIALSQIILSAYLHQFLYAKVSKKLALWNFLTDFTLYAMMLASAFSISAAFIINYFYDRDKDWFNRSRLNIMARAVGTKHLANLYVLFNILGLVFASLASMKIFLYFLGFQFIAWFYSHKIQKLPFLREFTSSILTLAPIIAVWVHLGMPSLSMWVFFITAFFIILTKDLLKDIGGNRGNMLFGYKTVTAIAGNKGTIYIILAATFFVLSFFIWTYPNWNYPDVDVIRLSLVSLAAILINNTIHVYLGESFLKTATRIQKTILLFHIWGLILIIAYRYYFEVLSFLRV